MSGNFARYSYFENWMAAVLSIIGKAKFNVWFLCFIFIEYSDFMTISLKYILLQDGTRVILNNISFH